MVAQLQKWNPMVTNKVNHRLVNPWFKKVSFSKSHVIIKCQVSTNTDVLGYLRPSLLLFNEKKSQNRTLFSETKALSLTCFKSTLINVAINLAQVNDEDLYNILCQMPKTLVLVIFCALMK